MAQWDMDKRKVQPMFVGVDDLLQEFLYALFVVNYLGSSERKVSGQVMPYRRLQRKYPRRTLSAMILFIFSEL